MSNVKNTGAFLSGMLFGGLVGAAAALLYAPRSGEETRTVIREKSLELKDSAVERGEEIRHQAEELADKTRTRFEEAASMAKERANEMQQRSQHFIDEQRNRIMHAIENRPGMEEKIPAVPTANGIKEA